MNITSAQRRYRSYLNQQQTIELPHLIRNLERVKRNSHGMTIASHDGVPVKTGEWFPKGLPVWSYDLVLLPSLSTYDTEFVRAKNAGDAKDLIRAKYPNATKYDW